MESGRRGTLYVVATPIGNLADLTFRALDVLKGVDWILCEDTRRTEKLLGHYGLRKPMLSIFGPKEKREAGKVLKLLEGGHSIALLSDAGTPGLSDPGNWIVRRAIAERFPVVPLPGPSALACALSVSGLAGRGFIFLGFLRRKKGKMKKELAEARRLELPVVFFESPQRLVETLETAEEVWGEESVCQVHREMTKRFEQAWRGTLSEVRAAVMGAEILGEVTVILAPAGSAASEEGFQE